jgi:phosphohistidine swiveling domain-containing protein
MDEKYDSSIWKDSFGLKYAAYPFFTSVYSLADRPPVNQYEVPWKYYINYFHDGQLEGYLPKKEVLEVGYKAIDELLVADDSFVHVFNRYHEEIRTSIDLCLNQGQVISSADFEKVWPAIHSTLSNDTKLLFNFDFALNAYLLKLQASDRALFEEINSNIVEQTPSFISKATMFLQELTAEHPEDFSTAYDLFMGKFGWFQNSYKGVFVISKEWLWDFYLSHKEEAVNAKKAMPEIDPTYSLLTKVASDAITFRDDKKKLLLLAVPIMDRWLENICRTEGFNKSEMLWLTVDEVRRLVDTHDKKLLAQAKMCASTTSRRGVMLSDTFDPVDDELWAKIVNINIAGKDIKEITGMVGNRGTVTGKVRVVLNIQKEGSDFVDGEILVTSMTRPEYLPLMSKASAFITDEGGITSHAAIVAREMHKPCITGTRIATQVLKNGDLVKVDGDRGTITLVSNEQKQAEK